MLDFREKAIFEDVKVVDISDLAIRVDIEGKLLWIPNSQVDDDSEVWKSGDQGMLVISEWIANQKGLL